MEQYDREKLEAMEHDQQKLPQQKPYVPRPKWQLALAWIAIGVVVFAFLGTIYWMMKFKL